MSWIRTPASKLAVPCSTTELRRPEEIAKIFPVYIVKRYGTVRRAAERYGTAVPFAVLYGRTVRPYQGTVGH